MILPFLHKKFSDARLLNLGEFKTLLLNIFLGELIGVSVFVLLHGELDLHP
jgi:hypothetical protein